MLSKPDKAFGTVTLRDIRKTLEMLMELLRFFVFLETDFGTLKLILFYVFLSRGLLRVLSPNFM